jgi:phage shock protein C
VGRNFFQKPAYVSLEIIERSTNMNTEYKQLTRSTSNRMIAGVCAGLGEYLNIDPTIVRLLVLLAFFTGFGGIALVYLIMALVVPEQTNVQPQ